MMTLRSATALLVDERLALEAEITDTVHRLVRDFERRAGVYVSDVEIHVMRIETFCGVTYQVTDSQVEIDLRRQADTVPEGPEDA